MNIINLNSPIPLPIEHLDFVRGLIRNNDQCQPKVAFSPGTLSDLIDSVPVVLVDKDTQDSRDDPDVLGFYMHDGYLGTNPAPLIGLCLEKIQSATAGSSDAYMFLTSKVLIHEFAHAIMARTPLSTFMLSKDNALQMKRIFDWMEEPMANMITLQYFSRFDTDDLRATGQMVNAYDYARNFMLKEQPKQYQLGVVLYDLGIHEWWLWRSKKYQASTARANQLKAWQELLMSVDPNAKLIDEQRQAFYEHWWSLVGNQHREAVYQPSEVRAVHDAIANAITERDVERLAELIDNPLADVGVEDVHGRIALQWAAETDDDDIANVVFNSDYATVNDIYKMYDDLFGDSIERVFPMVWKKWLHPQTKRLIRARGAFGRF